MSDLAPTFLIEPMLSDDETKVSLRATARFINKSVVVPMTSEYVQQIMEQRGYGKFRIDKEQIKEITSALTETLEQIETEEDTKGLSLETDTIAEAIDAVAEVEISEDKLEAVLAITPAEGGKHITKDNAESLLKEAGVTYGVDDSKIQLLLAQAQQVTALERCQETVAFALMPVKGIDAQFVPLVDTANERILKPRLRLDGSVDMLDLGDLPTVKEDTPLMQKEPPTDGKKGINVCWEFLAPESGSDLDYKPGSGTEISKEDPLILLSTISGQPNLLERGMKVDDAVQVKAVDLHTGHMRLDANLLVKGDIGEGMKVRCEGDITVGGVIESADVKAKGNIIIGKGILGRTIDHSAKTQDFTVSVKAGGTLSAMFASYAKLDADGDIMIAEQLLHCDTTSHGNIRVGNEKTVGSQIVGGITRSFVGIETDILGTSAGVFTEFDLSGPFDLKHSEVACNHSIIDEKATLLNNMRVACSKFLSIPISDARNEHVEKIKNTITYLENEIQSLEEYGQLLQDECEKLCHGLTVRAKRKIQPNIVIKIGHSKLKITRDRESGELLYEDGEIHYRPAILDD
ncbi:MAG: DUF342 domain-containing protein [Gammaproteobacteria bacterium]|nr:DUF342 domain-containing protein [Gammaproteobacteria bacterium]